MSTTTTRQREQLTRCKECGAYINPKFGEVPPAEHAGNSGTLNDPRTPGDYDDICDVCNYGGLKGGAMTTPELLEKATARPWYGGLTNVTATTGTTAISFGVAGQEIGAMNMEHESAEADAAFIVAAVNSFEVMREALRELVFRFEYCDDPQDVAALDQARKALALAEGEVAKRLTSGTRKQSKL